MEITFDHGALKKISLPEGWFEITTESEFGGRITRNFRPLISREASFAVILRPAELAKPDAASFENILYGEFHSLDRQELSSLTSILEGMANGEAFQIESADTGYLNDRRVLRISGLWTNLQSRSLAYFIAVDSNCHIVEQLFFMVPEHSWLKFKPDAERIFLSAEWR